ncbi:hypothetical protein QMA40_21055 [Bacillus thuringiensis]|uniref:hypothetical protein n=1 Tax=Bacillus thuringiensis TaxID=1428 RepID=UPI00397798E6
MNDIQIKMELQEVEAKLKRLSGVSFQEHVRFILKISDAKFQITRVTKDEGIDGFKLYTILGEKKKKQKAIEIYSMHTKSPGIKTKFKKMIEDFENALKFADKNNYVLKKWYMVSNYEISTEEKVKLIQICESRNVEFEDVNPATLITFLNSERKIFQACCYFHAVYAPKLPYSDYSDHKFVEVALKDICEYRNRSFHDKNQLLKEIISNIFNMCFIEKSKKSYSNAEYNTIMSKRKMPKEYREWYCFLDNEFIKCAFSKKFMPMGFLYKDNEEEQIYIYIKNLFPLYNLCMILQEQLYKTGDYKVKTALDAMYQLHLRINKILIKMQA